MEPNRQARPQAPPQTQWTRVSALACENQCFHKLSGWFLHTLKFVNHCSRQRQLQCQRQPLRSWSVSSIRIVDTEKEAQVQGVSEHIALASRIQPPRPPGESFHSLFFSPLLHNSRRNKPVKFTCKAKCIRCTDCFLVLELGADFSKFETKK